MIACDGCGKAYTTIACWGRGVAPFLLPAEARGVPGQAERVAAALYMLG